MSSVGEKFNEGMNKPLKYYDVATTFSEFPDYVTLCVNISGCPCHCDNCSEPWLRPWVGTILTNEEIDKLIAKYSDINLFGLMGGDSNYSDCVRVCDYIHSKYPNIKVGIYSGRDWIDEELLEHIDVYKLGRWIDPYKFGKPEEWHNHNCGVLQFPWSNQLMFEKQIVDGRKTWINITSKFRRFPVGNPERYIVKSEEEK